MTGWSIAHPRARKAHRCQMCGRRIDPGETYLRGAGFDGSSAWTWKECAHCEAIKVYYDISDGEEYSEADFYEWSREPGNCEVEDWRHAAGYRMQWRARGGTLLPVPFVVHDEIANLNAGAIDVSTLDESRIWINSPGILKLKIEDIVDRPLESPVD